MGIFGSNDTGAEVQPAATGIQIQTSAYGKVVPICFGAAKGAPNLIWYGDFLAIPHKESTGGKGGGGGKGGSITTYTYQAAVAFGICQGPITGIGRVWTAKTPTSLSALGLSLFTGTIPQTAWGYLTSGHPSEALPYSGIAYVAAGPYLLQATPQLPNHNLEIYGIGYGAFVASVPDADPTVVASQLLSNVNWGGNFPASRIGDMTTWRSYCGAAGLWVSPFYAEQASLGDRLTELAEYTNTELVWSSGLLQAVPYGDENLSANGYTYTAPSAPVYDLDDDDFVADEGEPPVRIVRGRPADQTNNIQMEFLNRNKDYNQDIVEFNDQAAIDVYGKINTESKDGHLFCDPNAAKMSVQLMGQRQAVRNMYHFTLDPRYCLLDPMDIVSITDPDLELAAQWVRIKEITERDDGCFEIVAEEYLNGSGSAALYTFGEGEGFIADYNVDPGNVNPPVIFEPPLQLVDSNTIEVWAGISGGVYFGGAELWVSYDGDTYEQIDKAYGSARTGFLTQTLATYTGDNPDIGNQLFVDLTESRATLLSGTSQDAELYATACYVGGEIISYMNSTLDAQYKYHLDFMYRGVYDTPITSHAIGSDFCRLDHQGVVKLPVDLAAIGQTIYLKFRAFNIYQGAYQELSTLPAYAYIITGSALSTALLNPTNLTTNFVAGLLELRWDPIPADIRSPIDYEIRRGASWANSQVLGRTPNNRFTVYGDGTYWVGAHYQMPTGRAIYSAVPPSVVIAGSVLVQNIVQSYDEQDLSWPAGTFTDCAEVLLGSEEVIGLTGTGDILAAPDVFLIGDILAYGGIVALGIYEPPSSQTVLLPYVAGCLVAMNWNVVGVSVFDNVLTIPDILVVTDILGSEFAALVSARPQVAISTDGVSFGAWEFYAPGQYLFKAIKTRIILYSTDVDIQAYLTEWEWSVQVPDRFEKFNNLAVPAPGLTQAFTTPFYDLPTLNVQVTILNPATGDDPPTLTWTLNDFTVLCTNGGVGVARNVNVVAQGY